MIADVAPISAVGGRRRPEPPFDMKGGVVRWLPIAPTDVRGFSAIQGRGSANVTGVVVIEDSPARADWTGIVPRPIYGRGSDIQSD